MDFLRTIKIFTILIILEQTLRTDASTITCDYKKFASTYQCVAKNVEVFKSQSKFENAIGNHESLKANNDVTWIIISNGIMNKFPEGLENIFTNLEGIRITNMELKEISQKDLKNFPKLKFLNLSFNKISSIEDNMFRFNPKIEHISLKNNEIHHIGSRVFSGLKNLTQLFLKGNKCRNNQVLISAENKEQVGKLVGDIEAGKCN